MLKQHQNRWSSKGVTIIELMIAGTLFAAVAGTSYVIMTKTSRKGAEVQQAAKSDREAIKLFDRFQYEVENTITLFTAANPALQVDRPVGCDSKSIASVNWSLRPFPGYEKTRYDALADYTSLDPSDSSLLTGTDRDDDSLQMVYIAKDSSFNKLAQDGGGATYPTDGSNPIIVSSIDDLAIGAYAVIIDSEMSDVFRITSIVAGAGSTYQIYHTNRSYWNPQEFTQNYGEKDPNSAFVFQVEIVDYTLNASDGTLLRDDHRKDDGFNPSLNDFDPGTSASLARSWEPVLNGVEGFNVNYHMFDGTVTRNPVMGLSGEGCINVGSVADCSCANQLGVPSLQFISIDLERDGLSGTNTTFSPVNLKRGMASLSSNGELTGPPLYLTSPAWEKTQHPTGAGSGAQ